MKFFMAGFNATYILFLTCISSYLLPVNQSNAETEREKSLIMACKVLPLHSDTSGYSEPKALMVLEHPLRLRVLKNL